MRRSVVGLLSLLAGLASSPGFAAGRGGNRSASPGGQRGAPTTPAEAERAKSAKAVEEIRATLPQHAPVSKLVLPSKNASFLASLRYAEQPRADLDQYLDKLWNSSHDAGARRVALEALWQEAENPKWARATIEEFFRLRSNGLALHPVEETPAPEPGQLPPR